MMSYSLQEVFPASMPDDIYQQIMKELKDKGIMIVVDATKDLLMNVLEYHPFLIKPNNHELGEIFEVTLKTREDVIPYGKKLQERGARNVLISMAGRRCGSDCREWRSIIAGEPLRAVVKIE